MSAVRTSCSYRRDVCLLNRSIRCAPTCCLRETHKASGTSGESQARIASELNSLLCVLLANFRTTTGVISNCDTAPNESARVLRKLSSSSLRCTVSVAFPSGVGKPCCLCYENRRQKALQYLGLVHRSRQAGNFGLQVSLCYI